MSSCRLTTPQDFLTITPSNHDGYYVFGFPDFQVRPLKVANVFHRSFAGPHEDFILGVLSVLLIAILTEIFQVLLMRTSQRRVTRSGFHAAYVLDEITHFRNVFSHFRHRSRSKVSKSVMWSSLTILTMGAILIAAEVFAVYLTQSFKVYAPPNMYNLRGIQPVETTARAAIEVNKLTEKKRCVSPMMPDSNQSREFSIVACVNRSSDTTMDVDSKTTFVKISSWFHKAGSDHYIAYGNERTEEVGIHRISIRAFIMQSERGIGNGIMFEVNQTTLEPFARYLQARALQAAIENCNELFPSKNCDKAYDECQIEETGPSEPKNITLWEIKEDTGEEVSVTETVQGVVTRFQVQLSAPTHSLKGAFRVFATSATIEEVLDGQGKYVSMPHGKEHSTIEGLVSEEGRVAGVVLLGTILLAMLGLLILLRVIFKPITMASLARDAFDADDEAYGDDDYFLGAGPDLSQQSVWAIERDIVDPDLDEYGSKDTFDFPRDCPPRRGFWRPHDRGPV